LTTIIGYSELLLSGPTSLDDRELVLDYLRRIRTVAGDAADVVRRMRSFYRYSHTTELQPIDLNEMIDDVVKLTQPKWKDEALAHGVSVDVIIDSADVPGILGNGAELRELLTNLIFNAVDAITPKAAGVLRISAEVENDFVVLKVADTGIGMDEKTHSQCLKPFFTTKMGSGTGLGLSIAYGIVQQHGGSMEIKSTLGEGTTFMLRLPASKFIDKNQPPVAAPALPPKATTILLVEDQEPVRAAVCHLLERDKHVVIQAATGDEGLNLFKNNDIDLVITDRSMPGLSGDQLAERIKKQSSSTPVILLSGFGDFMKDSGELPEFVDLIVSKPCTLASLREAITVVIKA
jgi:CheY-like chemotaxis protein